MAAPTSSSFEVTNDGPVLNLINKRLRALRKKLNRISQMEEALSQGKTLNKEQEETFRSKASVLTAIDELEKLRQPLAQAVSQEVQLAMDKKEEKTESVLTDEVPCEETVAKEENEKTNGDVSAVSDLLQLIYFGSIFDVRTLMSARDNLLTRTHERNCCLTYDYVTDDDTAGDPLKEWDLDLISVLGGQLISRPVNSSLSHKNALQKCVEHAKLWLANSEQPIEPNSSITYAGLREKLDKIMASEYFTTTPEIKAPVEVAAAGGNYTSFQLPVYGSVDPSTNLDVSVESSVTDHQQEEEEPLNAHGKEIYDEQPGAVEDHQQGESHTENVLEQHAQTELGTKDTENSRDVDSKEQGYPNRRPYQNYRGGRGGRRGYSNGRGGGRGMNRGGYQNGHGGQFYDQPGTGGYYPRNQHYRGRGGRGMGGNYNDGHATHAQAAS